jgi:hypothetical protein
MEIMVEKELQKWIRITVSAIGVAVAAGVPEEQV